MLLRILWCNASLTNHSTNLWSFSIEFGFLKKCSSVDHLATTQWYGLPRLSLVIGENAPSGVGLVVGLWQHTLHDLETTPDVAYQDVLNEFDSDWCGKGLISTRTSSVVTWKVRPRMCIISWSPSVCASSSTFCTYLPVLKFSFNLCIPKEENVNTWRILKVSPRPLGVQGI